MGLLSATAPDNELAPYKVAVASQTESVEDTSMKLFEELAVKLDNMASMAAQQRHIIDEINKEMVALRSATEGTAREEEEAAQA